jgi:hypothetical protein
VQTSRSPQQIDEDAMFAHKSRAPGRTNICTSDETGIEMNTEVNRPSSHSITIKDVLSDWHREILSEKAQKMFLALWFKMLRNRSTEAWFSDEQISIKAKILIQFVPSARAELVNAGLVTIGKGSVQWRYTYIEHVEPIYASDLEDATQGRPFPNILASERSEYPERS